jgi:hypothetical protein
MDLQQPLDAPHELRRVRLGARAEARDDAAAAVDEVLVEVPLGGTGGRRQAAKERVGVLADEVVLANIGKLTP